MTRSFPILIRLSVFLVLFISSYHAAAQNLPPNTTWEGKLVGMRFLLKLSLDSLSKQTTAVFDSLDQGAFGLKISKLILTNDSLLAYSAVLKGDFKGKFNADCSRGIRYHDQLDTGHKVKGY